MTELTVKRGNRDMAHGCFDRLSPIMEIMKDHQSDTEVKALLRLAVMLWIAYLVALTAIDHLLYRLPLLPLRYYLINATDALLVLGVVLWQQRRGRSGATFLPYVIGLMSIVPMLFSNLAFLGIPPNPNLMPEAMILRTLPILLIALVLTAWQYPWQVVVFFSLGINLFGLMLHLMLHQPYATPILPPVIVLIIQTVSMLVVGYFISVLVTRMKQQQNDLEKANARLVQVAGTLEDLTISRERNRLARELHDTLAHTLSALSVQLETAKAYEEVGDADAVGRLLGTSLAATRSGLQETRRALKALRASPVNDLGLSLALRQVAEENATRANVGLELAISEHLPTLPTAVEQTIYRIAQEALANAVHHANATTFTVALTADEVGITLQVQDNGRGFSQRQEATAGHYGLAGMQERAQLVGGQLTITSHSGEGTTVRLTVRAQGYEDIDM